MLSSWELVNSSWKRGASFERELLFFLAILQVPGSRMLFCQHSNVLLLRRENVLLWVFFKLYCCIFCSRASFMMAQHCALLGNELEVMCLPFR